MTSIALRGSSVNFMVISLWVVRPPSSLSTACPMRLDTVISSETCAYMIIFSFKEPIGSHLLSMNKIVTALY